MKKAAIYDHQFLSSIGIKSVLEAGAEPYRVKLFDTTQQLSIQLDNYLPDLLILEYLGENQVQPEVLQQIKRQHKKMKFLIISEEDDTIEIKKRIAIGIDGFITKKCSFYEVQMAIDAINRGGKFYCQKVLDIITNNEHALSVELSPREIQIIQKISQGAKSTEMAEKLNLSIHTINSHRKNIIKKLGFKSPTELIAYAIRKMA